MSDKANVFTGLTFSDSLNDISNSDRKAASKRTIVLVGVLILLAAGIGIAIGYGIFHSSTPGPVPTAGNPGSSSTQQPDPSYDSWLDVPCNDYGEPQCPFGYEKRPLVVVSLDGFRGDYLGRNVTPNIEKLANCGAHAPYMRPVYPTYTFPNHYSIVTGLFPESHGIIANSMYDPVFRTVFSYGNAEAKKSRWWGGEPIWVTAVKQGLRSASFFWTGSDVEIAGVRPTYYFSYDGDTTYEQRVDTVLSWISMPEEKRPNFITLYFDQPDTEGHVSGPFSDDTNNVLKMMDKTVGDLMDGMLKLGLHNCVDLMVLADHGMTELSCNRVFFMGDYIDTYDYYYRLGAVTRLDPKSNAEIKEPTEVVDRMQCQKENVTPYVKWELPKNWHYANNRRIEDILIVADDGWTISLRNDSSYKERYCSGGTHGYDNKEMTMGALFLAHGPSFKQNIKMETFLATELYNLMADILDLEPAPNNGTRGSLNYILRNPKPIEEPDKTETTAPSDCPYPSDYNQRIELDASNCTCDSIQNHTDKTIEDFDEQLKLSPSEVNASLASNTPFGRPRVRYNSSVSHCVLTQTNYVTGYSHDLKMPLWASYTIQKQPNRQLLSPLNDCSRPDVRVLSEHSSGCYDYESVSHDNITKSYLYPPGISDTLEGQMDALISSNLVPQMEDFVTDIWNEIEKKLVAWADKYNGIHVTSGPVFDYNYDSLRDTKDVISTDGTVYGDLPIPTHYFMIVVRCHGDESIGACKENAEVISFIISNLGIKTCQSVDRYLQMQLANIRDIEVITDLLMLPDLPMEKYIALKNYLPTELWEV